MRILRRLLIALVTVAGLLVFMTVPIMVVGFLSIRIWGPDLMDRSLGPDHASTWFFLMTAPTSMLVSAAFYIVMVILPVFAKYDIPIAVDRHRGMVSVIARWARGRAIRYAQLLEKY